MGSYSYMWHIQVEAGAGQEVKGGVRLILSATLDGKVVVKFWSKKLTVSRKGPEYQVILYLLA